MLFRRPANVSTSAASLRIWRRCTLRHPANSAAMNPSSFLGFWRSGFRRWQVVRRKAGRPPGIGGYPAPKNRKSPGTCHSEERSDEESAFFLDFPASSSRSGPARNKKSPGRNRGALLYSTNPTGAVTALSRPKSVPPKSVPPKISSPRIKRGRHCFCPLDGLAPPVGARYRRLRAAAGHRALSLRCFFVGPGFHPCCSFCLCNFERAAQGYPRWTARL